MKLGELRLMWISPALSFAAGVIFAFFTPLHPNWFSKAFSSLACGFGMYQAVWGVLGRVQYDVTPYGLTSDTWGWTISGLRRVFPNTRIDRFAITFIDNRAQSINLTINSSASPDSFEYGQSEASRFYEYIFGYRPPIWRLLASRFSGNETIYSYDFCLGDGVSTGFVIGGADQVLMGDVDLRYNSQCEPPDQSIPTPTP